MMPEAFQPVAGGWAQRHRRWASPQEIPVDAGGITADRWSL